jgi:histone H3/H4
MVIKYDWTTNSSYRKNNKKYCAHRVSEDAKEALGKVLEELGEDISKQALLLAKHAGRVTVKHQILKWQLNK